MMINLIKDKDLVFRLDTVKVIKSGDKKYKVLKLDKAPIGVRACKSTEFGGM